MKNHYFIGELTEHETDKLNIELLEVWEVSTAYWYPLKEINRPDVIAFELDYLLFS